MFSGSPCQSRKSKLTVKKFQTFCHTHCPIKRIFIYFCPCFTAICRLIQIIKPAACSRIDDFQSPAQIFFHIKFHRTIILIHMPSIRQLRLQRLFCLMFLRQFTQRRILWLHHITHRCDRILHSRNIERHFVPRHLSACIQCRKICLSTDNTVIIHISRQILQSITGRKGTNTII